MYLSQLDVSPHWAQRAPSLGTASHRSNDVDDVLPAPNDVRRISYEQVARATELVLSKSHNGLPHCKVYCCTVMCLETSGYLEFLGINVYNVLTSTASFYSTDSSFAHFENLTYDGQNKCMHALFLGEMVELHVILVGGCRAAGPPATSSDDTDDASATNDKQDSCYLGVCDLTSIANNGVAHVFEFFELCCRLVFYRMIHSVFLSSITSELSVAIPECTDGELLRA